MRPAREGALSRRVRSLAGEASDQRSLKHEILDSIRHAVGFDAYAWVSTDPETEVGSAPLADVPCIDQLPRLIRLKYLTTANRWTNLDGVTSLAVASHGHLETSLVWRELLAGLDVIDVASMVLRDGFGCWGFLDLWRIRPGRAFDRPDLESLADVVDPVASAMRRSLSSTFVSTADPSLPAGAAVLALSPELDVLAQTQETESRLRRLLPTDVGAAAIPAAAYNAAAQLLAVRAGVDAHQPWARVNPPGGPWLTVRASWMTSTGTSSDEAIAVTIEPSSSPERLSLFSRVFGLTSRESELLGLLARGFDTRGVADAMFISTLTVQDHLKSIFRKTGAGSRRELVGWAMGG